MTREINLELTGEGPPCWLAFIVLEGPMQPTGEEKIAILLTCAGPCMYNTELPDNMCSRVFNSDLTSTE